MCCTPRDQSSHPRRRSSVKAKRLSPRRGRIQKAGDAQVQLEGIEKKQRALRKKKEGLKISSIQKSMKRWEQANRNLRTLEDFENEYD